MTISARNAFSIILLAFAHPSRASVGDRSPAYQSCVHELFNQQCASWQPSLSLRLTFWTCLDDCKYQCQQILTDKTEAGISQPGLPERVVQFHGKWPFRRLGGIQEPASVLFSLLNLWAHAVELRTQWPFALPMSIGRLYHLLPYFGVNTWIWSTVFHTRDTRWTERLDYFSAAAGVAFQLYLAIVRVFGYYTKAYRRRRRSLAYLMLAIFAAHCSYLTLWNFDYGYNMIFNVSIGLLHNFLWYGWSVGHHLSRKAQRPRHIWQPVIILTLFTLGTALELLDFPPLLRTIDAHSLWHLSTILVIRYWYRFHHQDTVYLANKDSLSQGKVKS